MISPSKTNNFLDKPSKLTNGGYPSPPSDVLLSLLPNSLLIKKKELHRHNRLRGGIHDEECQFPILQHVKFLLPLRHGICGSMQGAHVRSLNQSYHLDHKGFVWHHRNEIKLYIAHGGIGMSSIQQFFAIAYGSFVGSKAPVSSESF